MNEQRQQAYYQLIQSLLSCPSGEEADILTTNNDLLDADFLKALGEVIEYFTQQGNEKNAGWLRNLATQLATRLNLNITISNSEDYARFLGAVMRATIESNGDAQVVYPLLANNITKLDDNFIQIFYHWAANILAESEEDTAIYLSRVICKLSNLIIEFTLGDIASNVEIAMAGYEIILNFYVHVNLLEDLAMIQSNLAGAYQKRIRGDKAENLEQAITAYSAALQVFSHINSRQDWAKTQYNLGVIYVDRIRGDKAENLELAIIAFSAALQVFTHVDFPQDWAVMQNNLGVAYKKRIRGDKAENLEQSIAALSAALQVYTHVDFPQDWAMAQINLGNSYVDRIRGDKAENLEQAITALSAALLVYTYVDFPQEWALVQNNLGIAYRNRIRGDKANNLEQAITAYSAALLVYTYVDFPQEWALVQNNLSSNYIVRIKGDEAENLEKAITACYAALQVFTCVDFPQDWARIQNTLGIAYRNRIKGDKAENLEQSITALSAALQVYTHVDFPQDWAMAQYNLGTAYKDRIREDKAENLELAINILSAILKILTQQNSPARHAQILLCLGSIYQDSNQLVLAKSTFSTAIDVFDSLRDNIVSGQESKLKLAEESIQIYTRIVEVCLDLGQDREALEYVERSKTRNLVEQILECDSKTIFPPDVAAQLETYRDEIAIGQYQIQNSKAENPKILAQHLQQLRQQRNELQNRYVPVGYGFNFNSFQATLDERTAIIEWYILDDKILVFIITHSEEVTVWQSQPENREALGDWSDRYSQNYYYRKNQWQNSLEEELKKLASILHIDEILTHIPNDCDRLILIPHRFLHLLPLHALPVNQNSKNSRCLIDLFAGGVSYAPSCQILQQVQQRERPEFQSLFAIQNPTEDLNYTDLEVQVIQSYFDSNTSNVLKKTAATLAAIDNSDLNTYHCAHFSCHGYFNLTNPGKSALILANAPISDTPTQSDSERYLNVRVGETHDLDRCLTLDKIFTLKLEKCRLVTLSACETGLIDFYNNSDEYIGLHSGFLLAGSPCVVSSLWTVNDLSTSFLMIKLYENLTKLDNLKTGDVAIALKQAQTWLRHLTIEGLDIFLEEHKPQIEQVLAQLRPGQRIGFQESLKIIKQRQPLPFANPYYWAGFTASGL